MKKEWCGVEKEAVRLLGGDGFMVGSSSAKWDYGWVESHFM